MDASTFKKNHKNYSNLIAAYSFDDESLDATNITGLYHGDIKKHYSSTETNDAPLYIENSMIDLKKVMKPLII